MAGKATLFCLFGLLCCAAGIEGEATYEYAAAGDLLDAAKNGDLATVERILTTRPNAVHDKDAYGWTPLHRAAWTGQKEVAEKLIKAGANIEATDSGRHTPLHLAANYGNVDTAKILVAAGANVLAEDALGNAPLALCRGKAKSQEQKRHRVLAKFLEENGGDGILAAAKAGHVSAVKRLLAADAGKATLKDDFGNTALHVSARAGHAAIAEVLVTKGADVNARNNWGSTPLHFAAGYGHTDIAKLLVANGAGASSADNAGNTPLADALARNKDDAAAYLEGIGAK